MSKINFQIIVMLLTDASYEKSGDLLLFKTNKQGYF